MTNNHKILVSSCLIGHNVKYDGGNNLSETLLSIYQKGMIIPICPETSGGLPTPRSAAQIVGGGDGNDVFSGGNQVLDYERNDVTAAFIRGAKAALNLAQQYNIRIAILKESSPSCGSTKIYNGLFDGNKKPGVGVTAALLQSNDISVYSENTIAEALSHYRRL